MNKIILFIIICLEYFLNNSNISCSYHSIELNRNKIEKSEGIKLLSLSEKVIHTYEKEEDINKLKKLIETKTYETENNLLENQVSQVASVEVVNYFNVQYYGNIYIGSNHQEMTVIFDTGSNILWISDNQCANCRNFTNKYENKNSTTFQNLNMTKNITYAIGYVNGDFVQDDVYINKDLIQNLESYSMGVKDFKFLLVNEELFLDGTIADGVLGLGVEFEGDSHNSFIQMLYQQGQIKSPYFTFYLTDSKKGSRLYLGDITENQALNYLFNQMNYCSVKTRAHYWQCDVSSITLQNNINSTQSNIIPSTSKVIFDTGTSFLIIPANDFLIILPNFMSKALNNKCGVTPSLQFICQCKSPKDFDDIIINFNYTNSNQKFVVKSENIIEFFPTLEFQCRFEVLIDIFMMDAWILGDSVLRNSLVTFDLMHRQVGWVQELDFIQDNIIIQQDDKVNTTYATTKTETNIFWYILAGVLMFSIAFYVVRLAMNYANSLQSQTNSRVVPLNSPV